MLFVGKTDPFIAPESGSAGFVQPENVNKPASKKINKKELRINMKFLPVRTNFKI